MQSGEQHNAPETPAMQSGEQHGTREPHAAQAAVLELAFLHLIPDQLRELVANSFQTVNFEFGDEIIREGDPSDAMYVIVSGNARVVKRGLDGKPIALNKLGSGDSFGELGLLSASPRTATVRASGHVEALRLDSQTFSALIETAPEVRERIELYAEHLHLRDFLLSLPTFRDLPDDAIVDLLLAVEPTSVTSGEVVLSGTDDWKNLYIVRDGRLVIYNTDNGNKDQVIRYLRSGDLFGGGSLTPTPPPSTLRTEVVSDSQLLLITVEDLERLETLYPAFRSHLEDRLHQYSYKSTANVPIDFASEIVAEDTQASVAQLPELELSVDTKDFSDLPLTEHPSAAHTTHRFPHLWQIDEMDCGATCLAMLCRYWEHPVDRMYIRSAVSTTADGTSLLGIVEGAKQLGMSAESFKISKDRLGRLPLPAIAHWDQFHWVVVYRVTDKHVYVSDPGLGRRRYGRDEFDERWSGYTALVSPGEDFLRQQPSESRPGQWFFELVKQHKRRIAWIALLALAISALELSLAVAAGLIVDHVVHSSHAFSHLTLIVVGIAAVCVAVITITVVHRYLLSKTVAPISRSSLEFVTKKLMALPYSFFSTRRTGDIGRRVSNIQQLRQTAITLGVVVASYIAQVVIAIALMFYYNWLLALIYLAIVPIFATVLRISSRKLRPLFDTLEGAWGRYSARQIDVIKGMEAVKVAGAEEGLRTALLTEFDSIGSRFAHTDFATFIQGASVRLFTLISLALFLWIGALEVIHHHLSLGGFVTFTALVLLANEPIRELLSGSNQIQYVRVLLNRMNDLVEHEPEQGADRSRLRSVTSVAGEIEFQDVGFAYPSARPRPVLSGITFKVEAGETVAIVGRSGSGKTTLMRLLTGLLEPTKGKILIDDVDLATLDYRELRTFIGFVLQENWLFEATIANNIALGEQEPDMRDVVRAAKLANAHEFINQLPLAYDTRIGEAGLRLSGGQRQRIAIARALYHEPPILILDEATSSLDTASERAIQQNLDSMTEGRTTFVIAHRLSTVRNANRIAVLERGRLVELGTHEELMEREGLYFYLSSQQLDV